MREIGIVGVPINPNKSSVKKSLASEFFKDLLLIFTSGDDLFGIALSLIYAVIFVIRWTCFLIGKFVFRLNFSKPRVNK